MINFGFPPMFISSSEMVLVFLLPCGLQINFSLEQKLRPWKSHFKKVACPEGVPSLTSELLAHLRCKADKYIWITLCRDAFGKRIQC